MPSRVIHYFDYKSPYAYLAQEDTLRLSDELAQPIEWLPYTLNIPEFLGAAELDAEGNDTLNARNDHQWRRVRYLYLDCRRLANERGLTLRGPRKIFDTSIAHIGFFYARDRGDFRPYHQEVFARFWRRELDIENPRVIADLLTECGFDASDFEDYLTGEGRSLHDDNQTDAESRQIFGVPSYLVDDELFWGNERLERVRELCLAG
jgi:2-hydroxychromene-2-carboxylate isomerase